MFTTCTLRLLLDFRSPCVSNVERKTRNKSRSKRPYSIPRPDPRVAQRRGPSESKPCLFPARLRFTTAHSPLCRVPTDSTFSLSPPFAPTLSFSPPSHPAADQYPPSSALRFTPPSVPFGVVWSSSHYPPAQEPHTLPSLPSQFRRRNTTHNNVPFECDQKIFFTHTHERFREGAASFVSPCDAFIELENIRLATAIVAPQRRHCVFWPP